MIKGTNSLVPNNAYSRVERFSTFSPIQNGHIAVYQVYFMSSIPKKWQVRQCCPLGWVNFSEFEITVCGSCKIKK